MRIRRFVVPIAITSALVVLGGITAGLIFARDQAPPIAPPEIVVSVPGSAATLGPELAATPEPRLAVMPDPDLKATPETQMGGSSEGASSEMEGANQGMVYTWQDGDRTLKAVLQATPVAQETETAAGASEDYAVTKGEVDSIVRKQSELGSGGQPVFRSESRRRVDDIARRHHSGPRSRVGTRTPLREFFSRNGISLERTSELDFLDNGFFVETEPGLSFPGSGQRRWPARKA